jgi:hypothetical protein
VTGSLQCLPYDIFPSDIPIEILHAFLLSLLCEIFLAHFISVMKSRSDEAAGAITKEGYEGCGK